MMVNYYGERVTKRVEDHHSYSFYKKRWSKWLWFEVIILVMCPIPFVEFYITFNYKTFSDEQDQTIDVTVR